MKILLKIMYWVICPYIGIGILVGKAVKNKFDNNLIGVFSGLFAGLVVFCIWMAIFGPSENTEIKEEVKVLETKTTEKPKKETLADKMYKELKPQELKMTNSEAITILEIKNNEPLTQIKTDKHDNLKDSWVRWATTFELKDKSRIKIYWKKDGNLFTEVEVVKKKQ